MHTVTFYSYKGGVGRTLVVANVAKYVARLGMKVFVLDFDLEAPGVHYKLEGTGGKPLDVALGLVDILSTFTTTRRLPEPLADFVLNVPSATGTINLLPAGDAPSSSYWKSLSKIDWHTLFYAERAEGIPLFLELKTFIEKKYAPDFLLIDARTGITEMGGVATTVLSDQVVCLMLPTREHLEGSRQVMQAISMAPRIEGASEVSLLAVLSRMPQKEGADEVERVKKFLNIPYDDMGHSLGIVDVPTLHREPSLEEREEILIGSGRSLDDSQLLQDYVRLFVKLVPPREIERFIGPLTADVEKRIMEAPDEAEHAFEALAHDCMHPAAYKKLLAVYRLRRSSFTKRLTAAQMFWKITGDATEPLLWDAIKDYDHNPYGEDLLPDQLQFIEGIWRSHGAHDARLAFALASSYEAARLAPDAVRVLDLNAATSGASAQVVVRLIELLCAEGEQDAADGVIARHKEHMANAPRFFRVWAEKALASQSYEELQTVLADSHFNLTVLEAEMPVLTTRLRLFESGDRLAASEFLKSASLFKRPRSELLHLGALARDLNQFEAWKLKLVKVANANSIVQEIETMPSLPTADDIPF